MTKEEILKIKEHIEIHARRECRAVMITEILWKAVDELEHITDIEKENEQLKEKNKILEVKNFEKCPFRYSDMGCDYCDWKDRDLKEEYEKELQEENATARTKNV